MYECTVPNQNRKCQQTEVVVNKEPFRIDESNCDSGYHESNSNSTKQPYYYLSMR
jgi:hypothetical protein